MLVGKNGISFDDIDLYLYIEKIDMPYYLGIDKYINNIGISYIIWTEMNPKIESYINEVVSLRTSFYGTLKTI